MVLGGVGLFAIVVGGFGALAYQNLSSARDDLNLATTDASELQDALTAGDQPRARAELTQLQSNVRSAQSTLDSAVLSVAAKTPFVGKNIKAVRTVTSAVSTVADDGLPPLVDVADKFNAKTFNPQGGRIDVDALAALTPNLTASAEAISRAQAEIDGVDASSLLSQLRDPVTDAQAKIGDAAEIATRATTASRVVPQLLQGKHTYLLMFQNNAEIRATGGLPGAYAAPRHRQRRDQARRPGHRRARSASCPTSASPLTDEEDHLFTDLLVTDFRDVNFTPDFPRAAEIATAIVKNENGIDVDGVLSIDPVTLSYLLKGTGPVDLEDGTRLTADNAVDVLLNGVYVTYPDERRPGRVLRQRDPEDLRQGAGRRGRPHSAAQGADQGHQRAPGRTVVEGRRRHRGHRRHAAGARAAHRRCRQPGASASTSTTPPAPRCSTTWTTRSPARLPSAPTTARRATPRR